MKAKDVMTRCDHCSFVEGKGWQCDLSADACGDVPCSYEDMNDCPPFMALPTAVKRQSNFDQPEADWNK